MKNKTQYLGIFCGAAYGLLIRLLADQKDFSYLFNIYSISFLWITPIVIGLFPILFASNQIYKSKTKLFFYPILTVILFLLFALAVRLEDLVCLLIISLPFLFGAGLIGLLLGFFVKERVKNKRLYAIVLLPILLNPIENILPNQKTTYSVRSEIVIAKSAAEIFPNVLEVQTISSEHYTEGFYQKIGIPRPIKSEVSKSDNEFYRIGYFTDNLKLYEYISEIIPNQFVNFKIDLSKSQLRQTPTDQHLLKSDYFHFDNINYTLIEISSDSTKVILNCDYTIESKMNSYANFWAKNIIKDFEERLLQAIKMQLEA